MYYNALDHLVKVSAGPLGIRSWTWYLGQDYLGLRTITGAETRISGHELYSVGRAYDLPEHATIKLVFALLRDRVARADMAYEFETLEVHD